MTLRFFIFVVFLVGRFGFAQIPVIQAVAVEDTKSSVFENGRLDSEPLANFRLHLNYQSQNDSQLTVGGHQLLLPSGQQAIEVIYEQLPEKEGLIRATLGQQNVLSKTIPKIQKIKEFVSEDPALNFSNDFTIWLRFKANKNARGTLFSKCLPGNTKWVPGGKALFIRNGQLVYDIGWVSALSGGRKVTDGQWHEAILVSSGGLTQLYLDGKSVDKKTNFSKPDEKDFVFKIGSAASNFGGDLKDCELAGIRYWSRAISRKELSAIKASKLNEVNTPDLNWSPKPNGAPAKPIETFSGQGQPGIPTKVTLNASDDFKINQAWAQPLEPVAHAELINNWSKDSLHTGKKIYQTLCITCHGDRDQEGSIPTAIKFHSDAFKNGSDPYRIYQTLTKGYGMMVPQPQYSPEQKYALIHYIREEFLRPDNQSQLFEITDDYLAALPKGLKTAEKSKAVDLESRKPYEKMDFGPALMWTYQVRENSNKEEAVNIAQKGINIRLDSGTGGVSKGKSWMVYETDTMRVAAAYHGEFVDWRGIAFDGSHGTHTQISGTPLFTTPDAPAWQNPHTNNWQDDRIIGHDGRRYGPTSDDWVRYRGLYYYCEEIPVIHYQIGDAEIYERPGLINYGKSQVFTRTLNIEQSPHDLVANIAPQSDKLNIFLKAPDGVQLNRSGENIQLHIPVSATPAKILLVP